MAYGYDGETETWLRKANGGAVGYIGSAPSSYWDEDVYWSVGSFSYVGSGDINIDDTTWGVYDAASLTDYVSLAGLLTIGNLAVTEDGGGLVEYYWQAYNVLGDASLVMYNTQGYVNSVSYMDILPLGVDYFEVTAEPGSYVAISFEGVLHGAGLIDADGTTEIAITPINNSGMADIVITRPQYQPVIEQVQVAPLSGPFVTIEEIIVNAGSDDIIEFGETVYLTVTLKNVGTETASNVNMNLSENDGYVGLSDASENFGNIVPDGMVTRTNAYTFLVDTNVPNAHNIALDALISAGAETWESAMNLVAYAPELVFENVIVNDANGQVDPDETVQISVYIKNNGGANIDEVAAVLSYNQYDTYMQVIEGTDEVAGIGASSTGIFTFTISATADTPVGHVGQFLIELAGENDYSVNETFSLTVGLCFEDFESGGFTNYAWVTNWEISSESQEGVYAAVSSNHVDSSTSEMSTTLSVLASDEISFYYKVSSEGGYDYLKFYIDGSLQGEWSGEIAWTQASYPVSVGEHTFKWEYYKDGSVASGSDCGWIDYIVFPPIGVPEPANFVVTPLLFDVTVDENATATETLLLSNTGGGEVTYSISLTEITNRLEVAEYVVDIAADIAKKASIAAGLGIPVNDTENYVNATYETDMRPTNVTISCDGGSWQSEISWTIENSAGTVVASGGCPFSGNASLDNGTYTVNGTDSYGDGWNGNYLIITSDDGTEYLNWTIDTGTEGTTTFIVNEVPPISWLELSQYNGSLEGNQTDEIDVTFNTAGLNFGQTYTAEMIIANSFGNDIVIPISLLVGEGQTIVYGDVDGNGVVQAMDASLTLQSVVGLIDLDATQTTAADVDGNGAVQAMDASYILQYVVGLITEFPIEGGRVVVDLDEAGVSVSDFDISTIAVGETFTINISTSELLEEWNVTAFQFNFAFDGSLIEYSGYNLDGLLSDGGMAAVNAEDSNTISVGFAGAYPLVGAGAIIELEFTKLTAGNCTTLLSNFLFNTEIIVNLIDGEVLETEESDIQNISKLNGNYPNPFSSTTTISFNLNNKNTVNAEIEIFNLKGQLVKSFALVNGQTSVEWNATSQASGIYFYKMKTDGKYTSTKKMILLK